jgi:hypothetical protein
MLKAEFVYGLQLFGGEHDLQTLFPHQAIATIAVFHDKPQLDKVAKTA